MKKHKKTILWLVAVVVAAMSLFCRIFEADPSVITLKGPAGEEEAVLRQVVRQILQNPPVIPDSYK